METSLHNVSDVSKAILALSGLIGLLIVYFRNITYNKNLDLIKLLIVIGFSHSIFGHFVSITANKYFFIIILIILLLVNNKVNRDLTKSLYLLSIFTISYLISFIFRFPAIYDAIVIYFILVTPLLLLLIFISNKKFVFAIKPLLKDLIILQIIISVVKLLTIGRNEAFVGTISHNGGSVAAIFPIVSLIFLWQKGEFKDFRHLIIWVVLLSLIVISSNKRLYWFILPFILLYFSYIGFGKIKLTFKLYKIFIIIPVLLLFVYFGFRLNPTLNPEKKVWGNFDFNYALNYAYNYTFGEEEPLETDIAAGRGSGIIFVFNELKHDLLSSKVLFGKRIDLIQGVSRQEDSFLKKYGFMNKGTLTGFTGKYLEIGIIGTILFLIYFLNLIKYSKKKRPVFNLLTGLFIFEFFVYKGAIYQYWAITIVFIYIVAYEYIIAKINDEINSNPNF